MRSLDLMEFDKEYLQVRHALQQTIPTAPPTPCGVGVGRCCDDKIPLTEQDGLIIINGVRMGSIPKRTIKDALRRLKDKRLTNRCPFLNEVNECSIYRFRPIVCMEWGLGGLLKTPITREEYEEKHKSSEPPMVNQEEVQRFACQSCQKN